MVILAIIIIIIIVIIVIIINIVGNDISVFPASFLSAFTLLGLPAEVYTQVSLDLKVGWVGLYKGGSVCTRVGRAILGWVGLYLGGSVNSIDSILGWVGEAVFTQVHSSTSSILPIIKKNVYGRPQIALGLVVLNIFSH